MRARIALYALAAATIACGTTIGVAAEASAAPAMPAVSAMSGSASPDSSAVTPFTVVNVGGGTWNYGSAASGTSKHCWSHYIHPSHQHTATAILGSQQSKASARPGNWANADLYGSLFDTCYAYWNVI